MSQQCSTAALTNSDNGLTLHQVLLHAMGDSQTIPPPMVPSRILEPLVPCTRGRPDHGHRDGGDENDNKNSVSNLEPRDFICQLCASYVPYPKSFRQGDIGEITHMDCYVCRIFRDAANQRWGPDLGRVCIEFHVEQSPFGRIERYAVEERNEDIDSDCLVFFDEDGIPKREGAISSSLTFFCPECKLRRIFTRCPPMAIY